MITVIIDSFADCFQGYLIIFCFMKSQKAA